MSAPELKRYMVPCGHGIEEHPAGLLHRREDVDKAIAEARREALREARDNISGSCWAMPSNGGTRSYNRGVQDSLSVVDALLDAEAPAQPKPDAVQDWQPIETAPRDGAMILVCLPRMMNLIVRASYSTVHKYWRTDHETDGGITNPTFFHDGDFWMPLPAPPKDRTHD